MTLLRVDYIMSEEKLVIDVIDNGGQWTHREWRMLRYLGVDTQILSNKTPLSELRKVDGLILSGGAARVGLTGELGNCAEYLTLDLPILGICAGHQFMAGFYGGQSQEAPHPEFGAATIELIDGGGELFIGTPDEQGVWESHNDEVIIVPNGFKITAVSENCAVQAMENVSKDRFGLQFHPEVNDSEYGGKIFENFVSVCFRARSAQ
jgi:GMP synthase (glutamine-hydrolysing)